MNAEKLRGFLATFNADAALRKKFERNPRRVLNAAGVDLPEDWNVQVYHSGPNTWHLVIPQSLENVDEKTAHPQVYRVMKRALVDPEFRAFLVADPKAAITQETGLAMPRSLTLLVHDSKPKTLQFVLANPRERDDELSDVDLELVAAGKMSQHQKSSCYATAGATTAVAAGATVMTGGLGAGALVVAAGMWAISSFG